MQRTKCGPMHNILTLIVNRPPKKKNIRTDTGAEMADSRETLMMMAMLVSKLKLQQHIKLIYFELISIFNA